MDPIADLFSQLISSQYAGKKIMLVPYSKLKMAILEILKVTGYVADFKEKKVENKVAGRRMIEVILNTKQFSAQRVSRPGRRVYAAANRIPRPKNQTGMVIISTSEGLMKGEEARKKCIGGEIIAEVNILNQGFEK